MRKKGLYLAISLAALLVLFFTVRPYLNDYQVSQKKEYLNEYLERNYPKQKWKITKPVGRQNNPNFFEVQFENETDWIYTYSVSNDKRICQRAWIPPNEELPKNGKHYESNNCE